MQRKSKGDSAQDYSAASALPEGGHKRISAALRILVSGRVQGVGFRYSCYVQARRLGLGGWVRNTPEGNVEIWLESSGQEQIETMLDWLRRGPPYARVDELHCNAVLPTGTYQEFSIKP
jgi:acylphosphatase